MNVTAWLQSLGLERYDPLFRDNEIDREVLPKLTSEDLKEIGVLAIGHRRKLLDASPRLALRFRPQPWRQHHHFFFCETSGALQDIAGQDVTVSGIPVPPAGTEISCVEVIVRVRACGG
jgi:hypothetical protein